MKLKEGKILIAKKTWYMHYQGQETDELFLVAGKSYIINGNFYRRRGFTITSECERKHFISYLERKIYFYTEKELRNLKLNQLNNR